MAAIATRHDAGDDLRISANPFLVSIVAARRDDDAGRRIDGNRYGRNDGRFWPLAGK